MCTLSYHSRFTAELTGLEAHIDDQGVHPGVGVTSRAWHCRVIRPEAGNGQDDGAPDAPQQEGAGSAAERRFRRRKVRSPVARGTPAACLTAASML